MPKNELCNEWSHIAAEKDSIYMQQSTRSQSATLSKGSGFPPQLAEPLGDQSSKPGPASLVGTWKLLSYEVRYSDGSVSYPWGPDAQGFLIYSADGYMMATLCNARFYRNKNL